MPAWLLDPKGIKYPYKIKIITIHHQKPRKNTEDSEGPFAFSVAHPGQTTWTSWCFQYTGMRLSKINLFRDFVKQNHLSLPYSLALSPIKLISYGGLHQVASSPLWKSHLSREVSGWHSTETQHNACYTNKLYFWNFIKSDMSQTPTLSSWHTQTSAPAD